MQCPPDATVLDLTALSARRLLICKLRKKLANASERRNFCCK
jgi:hypothetical protein